MADIFDFTAPALDTLFAEGRGRSESESECAETASALRFLESLAVVIVEAIMTGSSTLNSFTENVQHTDWFPVSVFT